MTVAMMMATMGHTDWLRVAVKNGKADISATNDHGVTAMEFAARNGRLSTVKLFVDELEQDPNH